MRDIAYMLYACAAFFAGMSCGLILETSLELFGAGAVRSYTIAALFGGLLAMSITAVTWAAVRERPSRPPLPEERTPEERPGRQAPGSRLNLRV
jgi:hypothetical protein